jgi:hypothetical protein
MAITFPRTDIMTLARVTDTRPRLQSRQEYSRAASGAEYGKDFGSAIWVFEHISAQMLNAEALDLEAALNSLDGVIHQFESYDVRRPFPKSAPTGFAGMSPSTGLGTIHTVGGNNKSLRLQGLPSTFVLSRGDYISFAYGTPAVRAFHQIMETVTAVAGVSPLFEVRPHLRPGAVVGLSVKLNGRGLFTLGRDTVDVQSVGSLHSTVSFQAIQSLTPSA